MAEVGLTERPAWLRAVGDVGLQHEVPLAYAQILFSRSRVVGLLLLLATLAAPLAGLCGLLAVLTASATARLLDLDPEARREGAFGYNALLIGLGLYQSFDGAARLLVLVLVAAPASVLLTTALRVYLLPAGLPALSWPFLVIFSLCHGFLNADHHAAASLPISLPAPIDLFLRALGALFFQAGTLCGALLLLALLYHSRIATLLAAAGFALAAAVRVPLSLPPEALVTVLGYNAAFTAMAIGGVWLVPSAASFLLALFAVALTVFGVAGTQPALVMVLPFNAVVTMLLLALRARASDRSPKAVDFLPGSPEENLSYFRTRLLRFRRLYDVRLQLPFRGVWLCTQGVDGTFTHKGRWRHAYDFEVRGADGLLFYGDGSTVEQYHAYRLPVLAAAAGTVVKVVNHVPDNAIGAMNLEENWGNLVLTYHAPGLYSLVAHLQRGSVKVVEGQVVRAGDLLGLCGSSGRSPQPHIHFHLQATPRMSDGTLPCRFNDAVVLRPASAPSGPAVPAAVIEASHSPSQGQELRNMDATPEGAAFLAFPPGSEWVFRYGEGAESHVEHVHSEVDLHGRRLLRSREHGTLLYYELGDAFFTIFDVVGSARSVLHWLRMALPRVSFEPSENLRWTDHLPARPLRTFTMRVLEDFVSPFLHHDVIAVDLQLRREGPALRVSGESRRQERGGGPLLRTEVILGADGAPQRIAVTLRGVQMLATLNTKQESL